MLLGPGRASFRAARGSQAGVSLLEALVVIVLVSFVVLTFAYGLQTAVTTDGRTNRQQRMNLALTSLSETLRQADWIVPCPASGDFKGESTLAAGYVTEIPDTVKATNFGVSGFEVTGVDYWEPGDFSNPADPKGGEFGSTCDANTSAVRIRFGVSLGGDSMSGELVKRDPVHGMATVGATTVVTP